MEAMESSPYVTVKEAAQFFRVSVGTVYNMLRERLLKGVRLGRASGTIRILKSDLAAFAEGGALNVGYVAESRPPAPPRSEAEGGPSIRPFKFIQLRQRPGEPPASSERLAG